MKNNKNIILIILLVVVLSISCVFTSSNIINTKTKTYLAANDDLVSTRELAMLASLVYEDVPDDRVYDVNSSGGCLNNDGTLKIFKEGGCFFKENGKKIPIKGSDKGYEAFQYIEGMSERKTGALMSNLLTSFVEDGQKYYFLNYADVSELSGSWTIYDYKTTNPNVEEGKKVDAVTLNNYFDAITFKKGDNYVIAYRGTDFPDLAEWITDFTYAINGENNQSELAYNYAVEVYEKVVQENPDAKFFVTGHSLGAYLAQIGGAAIYEVELGYAGKICESKNGKEKCGANRIPLDSGYFNKQLLQDAYDKTPILKNETSRLQQIAYFNGMGVSGLFAASNLTRNVANALTYLAITDLKGNRVNSGRYVNYSGPNNKDSLQSSGRLVLYSMDVDPISDIGFHYGEILKLEVGADAVTNHRGTHSWNGDAIKKGISNTDELEIINNPEEAMKNFTENLEVLIEDSGEKTVSSLAEIWNSIVYSNSNGTNTISNILGSTDKLLDDVVNIIDPESPIISPLAAEQLKEVFGTNVKTYNIGSIGNNLVGNLIKYVLSIPGEKNSIEQVMSGVFEYFNVNHETDSFMCLIDQSNGGIKYEDIDVTIEAVNLEKDENGAYNIDSKFYGAPEGYKLGDAIDRKKAKEEGYQFLILKANIKKGCAKGYQFMYNSAPFATTFNNEVIIPYDTLKRFLSDEAREINVGVTASYGNNYSIAKAKLLERTNIITYDIDKEKSLTENPTGYVSDANISHSGVGANASVGKTIKLKLKDEKSPKCRLSGGKTVKFEEGKNIALTLTCTSSNGFDKSNINLSKDDFEVVNAGTQLFGKSLELSSVSNPELSDSNTKINYIINVTLNKSNSFTTPRVNFVGTIKDKAGYSANIVNSGTKITITK